MAAGLQVEGLERVLRKVDPKLLAGPLRRFFDRAGITVRNAAAKRAPVDTGRLRASLAYEVDPAPLPLWAKVGTNVEYAPYMEFGTGVFAEGEGGGRHWPPGEALSAWAGKHGFASGFAAAAAIGKRGGLEPRRYLRGGLEESLAAISGLLDRLLAEIKAAWEAR